MTMLFWTVAASMVSLALACVLWPQRSAVAGDAPRWPKVLIIVFLPLLSWGLYSQLGAPTILEVQRELQGKSHDVEAMMRALESRLERQPDDAEGWFVLGRAYQSLQRLADAENALARAVILAPKEARYLSHHAEVLALVDKGDLQARARFRILAALELDPQDEKALELAGLSAYQREEWGQAAYYWRQLLKRLPPGSEFYQDIEAALKNARGMAERGIGSAPKP